MQTQLMNPLINKQILYETKWSANTLTSENRKVGKSIWKMNRDVCYLHEENNFLVNAKSRLLRWYQIGAKFIVTKSQVNYEIIINHTLKNKHKQWSQWPSPLQTWQLGQAYFQKLSNLSSKLKVFLTLSQE